MRRLGALLPGIVSAFHWDLSTPLLAADASAPSAAAAVSAAGFGNVSFPPSLTVALSPAAAQTPPTPLGWVAISALESTPEATAQPSTANASSSSGPAASQPGAPPVKLALRSRQAALATAIETYRDSSEVSALALLDTLSPRTAAAVRKNRMARNALAAYWGVGKAVCYLMLVGLPIFCFLWSIMFGFDSVYDSNKQKSMEPQPPAWALLSHRYLNSKAQMRERSTTMLCPETATPAKGHQGISYIVEGFIDIKPQDSCFTVHTSDADNRKLVALLSFEFAEKAGRGVRILGANQEALAFLDTSKAFGSGDMRRWVSMYRCSVDGVQESQPFAIAERTPAPDGSVCIRVLKVEQAINVFRRHHTEQHTSHVLLTANRFGSSSLVVVDDPAGQRMAKLDDGGFGQYSDDDGRTQRQSVLKLGSGVDPTLVLSAIIASFKLA